MTIEGEARSAKTEAYIMTFTCSSGTSYSKDIPKGKDARGEGGECPYCGSQDSYHFPFVFKKLTYY